MSLSLKSAFIALLGITNCILTQAVPQTSSFLDFDSRDTFINNTGLTNEVGWDSYSFYIQGKRIFLQSGEFHTWRLPVPALWKDITQKAKAAGLNALSIYVHWHLLNPKEGVIDMSGINDLQPLFDAAKEAGIFIIARPGPYINAETTNGGLPGHVATIPGNPSWNSYNGEIRSNDTYFHEAWQDYWNAVIPVIAKNQITNGGPVIMVQIENEYYNGAGQNEYVAQLRQRALDMGIPSTARTPRTGDLSQQTGGHTTSRSRRKFPSCSQSMFLQHWFFKPTVDHDFLDFKVVHTMPGALRAVMRDADN
ncbi:hypothetical protein C0991_007974 [Blastosporella zonata]|nr:hypothetical protein C0991_007974 [Blastosporella zonata]